VSTATSTDYCLQRKCCWRLSVGEWTPVWLSPCHEDQGSSHHSGGNSLKVPWLLRASLMWSTRLMSVRLRLNASPAFIVVTQRLFLPSEACHRGRCPGPLVKAGHSSPLIPVLARGPGLSVNGPVRPSPPPPPIPSSVITVFHSAKSRQVAEFSRSCTTHPGHWPPRRNCRSSLPWPSCLAMRLSTTLVYLPVIYLILKPGKVLD
jgi:hypothetical protein